MTVIDDALRSMTRRDLEALRARVDRELVVCMACGGEGAEPIRAVRRATRTRVTLPICLPCFERYRQPESRADAAADGAGA